MNQRTLWVILLLLAVFPCTAMAGDWPQFRYDSGRTAASDAAVPADLHLQWTREMAQPKPAFPGNVRLEFDTSYEPVVLGQTMFVPSMITESVTALDTATGEVRWRFYSDGPVRFAPVAWQDNVYFVSDDGYLYCLHASDGRLRWQHRGLPADRSDRKLLGNGQLISLFPARGGPVLRDGIIYFAAGLWPADGIFVHALNAETGKVVWSNTDSHHIPAANQDHGIAQFAGIAPQGYLAIVGNKLVVPCGAQLPAFFDLKTGEIEPYHMGWGGRDGLPKGTWFVAGCGQYLCQSGDIYDLGRPNDEKFRDPRGRPDYKSELYAGGMTRIRIDKSNHKDIGRFVQPVFTQDAFYENDGGITAYDLTSVQLATRGETKIPTNRQDDTYPDRFTAVFGEKWKLPSKLDVHVKIADQLFCAGPGTVAAIQIPKGKEKPQVQWQASVEGTPHRLLAADSRLFVVTREGRIHAFGAEKPQRPLVHARPTTGDQGPADYWTDTTTEILDAAKVSEGYAVVLGLESGRMVEELVRQSNLYVIAIDPDPSKIASLRKRLSDSGQYGTRACARVGDLLAYPFPPYLANLIVSEHTNNATAAVGAVVQAIFPKLHPFGGTACLALGNMGDLSYDAPAAGPLAGLQIRQSDDWALIRRVGGLPDTADWSHEEANAAGTGASTDRFVKAPLGLLWFDGAFEWHRKAGGAVVRIAGGRVFVKAQKLHAIDVFTGRQLWEKSFPFGHTAMDQLVTTPEAIYATNNKTCLILDPSTGKESRRIVLPDQVPGVWRNLRCWKDYLISTNGRYLISVNRHTGKVLWQHECNRVALSVCVGGGRVFCSELLNARKGETEAKDVKTRAFDLSTGEILWEVASGSKVLYSEPLDLLVTGSSIYQGASGNLLHSLPKPPKPANARQAANLPSPLFVVGDKLLWGTVESFVVFDLKTGQREGDRTAWVRRGCTTIRASEHLVTTRVRANAAYIDLDSREATSLWNIRPACLNNLYPANGILNAPNVVGGCTCNYTHTSQAYAPVGEIERASFGPRRN